MSQHGDRAEFEAFVRGHSTALLRTAYLLTGDRQDAEDLLQTALERTSRHWSSIAGSPEAYVRKALANTATSWWRRKRLPQSELLDELLPSSGDATATFAERDALIRALMTLPARQRAVLVLRYFEDLSEAQTAEALGSSIGTVKSQASRGLSRLRDLIDDPNPDHAPARSSR